MILSRLALRNRDSLTGTIRGQGKIIRDEAADSCSNSSTTIEE